MSAAKMVKRVVPCCECCADYVTDADAARLEAVVEAAGRMRERLAAVMESDAGVNECFAELLESIDAFDAARDAMGEK